MKLTEIKCHNCGAPLSFGEGDTLIKCEQCGEIFDLSELEAEASEETALENTASEEALPEEAASEEAPAEEVIPVIETPEAKKRRHVSTVYDYAETFCYALALMMVLFLFVFRYVSVDGESMRETLQDSDKLIISDLFYTPETGDIVVIQPESHKSGDEPIIKRVIATAGQKVYIDYDNWEVYVDGVKLDEPYIEPMREYGNMRYPENPTYYGEFTVEEGRVFVMGDNRNHSKDSRSIEYGEIPESRILGRVLIRLWPNFGKVSSDG